MDPIGTNIIAQAIGIIALCFTIIGFQLNNRKKIIFILTISASLYSVHFLSLGALTGAAMNALNISQELHLLQKVRL
jgi:glycerol uptake facilitator-like aquaporin